MNCGVTSNDISVSNTHKKTQLAKNEAGSSVPSLAEFLKAPASEEKQIGA
jgi:hypothetical protein